VAAPAPSPDNMPLAHPSAADPALRMFQVNFSDQAMTELNKLEIPLQLGFVDSLSAITHEQLAHPREPLGRFARDRTVYYRLRSSDLRGYFAVTGDTLHVHYLLTANSLGDFVFRTKLPFTEETLIEQSPSFWGYLESLKKR